MLLDKFDLEEFDDKILDYFDYKKWGDDLQMSGELYEMLVEEYGDEKADEIYDDIRGGVEAADYYFDMTGTEPSDLDQQTLVNYFNFKMFIQDLGYEGYTMYGTKSNPILFHNY